MSSRRLGDLLIPTATYSGCQKDERVDVKQQEQNPYHTSCMKFQIPNLFPDINCQDFVQACDTEFKRQTKRRCNRIFFPCLPDTKCHQLEECTSCQVKLLMEDLTRHRRHIKPCQSSCRLCNSYVREKPAGSQNTTNSSSRVDCNESCICNPPPSPGSPMPDHLLVPNSSPVATSTPAWNDSCSVNQQHFIKQCILSMKTSPQIHHKCRARCPMFMYTEMTVGQDIIHRTHCAMRGHAIQTKLRRGRDSTQSVQSAYGVTELGLIYSLSENNPPVQPRHKLLQGINYAEILVLPEINVAKLERTEFGRHIFTKPKQKSNCLLEL